ncbi:ABC transporter ATP-binding protein [Desulfonema ishimotonii]|uniref:ABC transporter ATP-binding protein n=1 Tax=Desulfonema ishimotonii TaxID=45657 RepID=A0A401FX63_9BACT|nr:ABC transporter ATP-binding protein [Desulfonema ishimotonii]GBC61578.1 ABC transporter ATP-binding protein [Desulfonema ishimotonii]
MFSEFGYAEEKSTGKPYDLRLLKRLMPFVRPYRTPLLGALALVMMLTALELALPYITRIAVDRYIVPPPATHTGVSGDGKGRYADAEMSDPEMAALVRKYPDFFQITGTTARIPLADLPKLDRADLMRLRRDDIRGVSLAACLFLLLIIADFVLTFFQVLVLEYAGQKAMHDLRVALFTHIQSLRIAYFNRNPIARLVTRTTNDIQNMHELFTSVLVAVFKDLFLLVGIMAVMLGIRWQLALICFTLLPFVVFASLYFSRLARNVFRTLRIKTAEINTRFAETIAGIRVIQLFRQEQENARKFRELNHEFYAAGMRQIHIFAVFMPLIEVLTALSLALVICYGGQGVMSEEVTLGILVAFISYMRMFFRPIREIAEKYNILQNAMSSAERIFMILDTDEREVAEPVSEDGERQRAAESGLQQNERIETLVFDRVSMHYRRGEDVLREISFQVRAGETIAIVGPTGSGKTSLINLIIRFYDPASGRVLINGRDTRAWDLPTLRRKIALVTQDPFLFSENIRENIIQGKAEISAQEMDEILAASNCRELVRRLPQGAETRLSEGGASLSSGERQLISIARAFARDPELIILDEATSYIDSETEVKIQEALSNLMRGRTAILVAHRLSTAREADTILVLSRGRITEAGSHEALMEKRGVYFKLNQLQR